MDTKYGYKENEIDREYITGLIKPLCENANELRVKREQIGIIAANRAYLIMQKAISYGNFILPYIN